MAIERICNLLLLSSLIHAASCGHSLQYYHTTLSSPGHGLPQYISVGYVDGIQITHYSSDTGRAHPVAPWMKKVEDPEYWEEEAQNGKRGEHVNKLNVKIAMSRFNQTGGFHSFQEMYGCELRDDGSTRGYWQFGYDGKDFLSLDPERWVYYPLTDQAQISARRWNSPEVRAVERAKDYLETECIDSLKKYLEYGKEELERRVRPEVKVSGRRSDVTKLHCQVYGFYPRDVKVNWKKNEMDIPSDEAKQILPNTDGTFQIRVTVDVTPEEGASYACHVDHSSLNEPLIAKWDTKKTHDVNIGLTAILTAVPMIFMLVVIAVAVFKFKLKFPGNKKNINDSYLNNFEKPLHLSDAKPVSHKKNPWDADDISHIESSRYAKPVSHKKSLWDAELVSHIKSSRYYKHDAESLWDAEHFRHRKRRWSFDNKDIWREKQEEISLKNCLVTEDGYAVKLSCPQTMNRRLSFSLNRLQTCQL